MAAKKKKKKKSATGKKKKAIIKTMGLFWSRASVRWRGNKKIGPSALFGVHAHAKLAGDVDCWNQVGIYALYADYRLVYVGQAGIGDKACIGKRLKDHTTDDLAGRWDMFSWFGLKKVNGDGTLGAKFSIAQTSWTGIADILEGVLIEVAEPPMNSQRGRFGKDVHRYLQSPALSAEKAARDAQKEQAKKIDRIEKLLVGVKKKLGKL